jgi:hypothetical protein
MSQSPCMSRCESHGLCNRTVLSPDARIVCKQSCEKFYIREAVTDRNITSRLRVVVPPTTSLRLPKVSVKVVDVVVVVVVVVPPPAVLVVFVVLGYLAPRVRALGAVIKLVGPTDLAGAVEWAIGVGEVTPVLAVTALPAQRARVRVAAMFPGVLVRPLAASFLAACATTQPFAAVA